ncbi:XdhC family protein [Mucilaginibacter phyllosphaerae]|uniref:Xanthine/CO dehydrogenase XdhC/CoxF family maturation factor n=1 Tax=Mucilaginibacter phyllosphaerae TaxID=1812349 RepID=A0A4Y8ABC7_9SPHI|nr:XdhC/CoxI family protein [Mucilaginibacter phyllosphaerae]MBB3969398.1 xanthine/CO dehydrogenase XdhC/CoxF family maturation factor [Mucilaginibacter phyllosphaerae]TEW65815.1 XdhC/CoxI family protein [Mucilaginibacter phyllosphaerae]GGH08247.1 putative xanthine dehydrogenase subunit A [Mucilaginibacter phyllosphaerae]
MKELYEIVSAYDRALQLGEQTALATVVQVEGSSYRRAGARMLVTDSGNITGAISGGCLEGDALRKARMAMHQQKPVLVTYDTTDDDDARFGVGLGCNGIIHILIEPINSGQPNNPVDFFKRFLSKRRPAVLLTVFNTEDRHAPQYGTCLIFDKVGGNTGALPADTISEAILVDAAHVLDNGNSATKTYYYQNNYTCFIELLQPAVALVIAGAGNDAIPLVQMAKLLGWQVTVVDGRANYATSLRFPQADKLVVAKPAEVTALVPADERTVFMLMTHNYNYDTALLRCLLPLQLNYIGILGPKKRLNRMLDEIMPGCSVPNHLFGPAGLDTGSENAEEIALAILAEIQAVLNKRNAAHLKTKPVIHDRAEQKNRV